MRKHIFLIFSLVVSLTYTSISANTSDWKSHSSYEKNVLDVERMGNKIYAVAGGKLFSCDATTNEVFGEQLKTSQHDPITKIVSDTKNQQLLIIRKNYEIDFFDGEKYSSISSLREASFSADKKINDVSLNQDLAYLSTNFGMVVIDLKKREVKEICLFRFPVYSVSVLGEYIYASTSKGVYRIKEDQNIQNFNEWVLYSFAEKYTEGTHPFVDGNIRNIVTFNDKLYFIIPDQMLYSFDGSAVSSVENAASPNTLEVKGQDMFAYNKGILFAFKNGSDTPISFWINNLDAVASGVNDGEYWVGLPSRQLSKIKQESSNYTVLSQNLKPSGPWSNFPFGMTYTGGKVRAVGGGYYYDLFATPAQLSEFDNTGWYNYARATGGAIDFTRVAANPADPNHLLVSSWGQGVFEFKDRKFIKLYNKTNSSLQDIYTGNSFTRIDGLKSEGPNKFWMCNTMVSTVVNLYQKEGDVWKWYGLNYPEIYTPVKMAYTTKAKDIVADSRGNKWVVSESRPYIFIFNENATPGDISDDKRRLMRDFYDQDGVKLIVTGINKIDEDKKGNIWVLSESGLFMIKKTDDVFNDEIVLNRIELTKDDGSGIVNTFLNRSIVNNIAFDDLNRKWIATEEDGVFLLDDTSQKELAHFTMDNSPLPTNRVLSIAVDDNRHAFMGTADGIIEYSGAADGESTLLEGLVEVSPNPISKSFIRDVTISGLKKNSFIKIVDKENNIVSTGVASKDGILKWNGRSLLGNKTVPGIYFVIGITEKGEEGMLAKVKVIN